MTKKRLLSKFFEIAVREGLCSSAMKLKAYLNYLFQDISSFRDKKMLDVGCGSGLYSFYAACRGAKYCICLEPLLGGSTKDAYDKFRILQSELSLSNVYLYTTRIQDFNAPGIKFDILLLHNSINHLDEDACINLQYDKNAKKRYIFIFEKLRMLAAPRAKLIITDCSPCNFFARIGIRNPFAPNIEWHKHQSPEFWASMLSNHGFTNPRIRWTPLNALIGLGRVGKLLSGNRFVSYFLISHFLLVMDKIEHENAS